MAEKKAPGRVEGMRIEGRKIQWPTVQQTAQYTLIVLGIASFVALVSWGLDLIFNYLVGLAI